MLVDHELDVQYHVSNGYLVIMDSVQGHLTGDTYGLFRLLQLLARTAQKHAKSGIFSISDMGSFFLYNREKELINYELSIPKNIEIPVKAFCCYHNSDFELRLAKKQQGYLSNHHRRTISCSTCIC